ALVAHPHPVAAGAELLTLPAPVSAHPDFEFALLLLLAPAAGRTRLTQHRLAALLREGKLIEDAVQTGHGEVIGDHLLLVGIRREPFEAHRAHHLRGDDHE